MKAIGKSAIHFGKNNISMEDAHRLDDELGLYVVCDGSHDGDGKWAAQTCIDYVYQYISKQKEKMAEYAKAPSREKKLQIEAIVKEALQSANRYIYLEAQKRKKPTTLTTVEVLLVLSDCAIVAHIGNSRTYWMREKTNCLLTQDHTQYDEMIGSGMWAPDRINPAFRKSLTRSVGSTESIFVNPVAVALVPGDLFLLCTDGLSDHLTTAPKVASSEMHDFATKIPFEQFSQALVETAVKKGATDNVTALVVKIVPSEIEIAQKEPSKFNIATKEIEVIRHIPIFQGIVENEVNLLRIQSLSSRVQTKKGTVIVQQGDPSNEMYILVQGKANVLVNGEIVQMLKSGDLIGEMGMFHSEKRSATVISTEDSEMMHIKKADFLAMMKLDKDLGLAICMGVIRELSGKLRSTSEKVVSSMNTLNALNSPNSSNPKS